MENNRLQKALAFATEKHRGQLRKGGSPYITHPIAVAEYVKGWGCDEETQITALFHDLLEDTDATEAEIEVLGGKAVLVSVKLLTKEKGYNMAEYVERIKQNPMAKVVKAADRLHNLRCATEADEAFRRKYIIESTEWYLDFNDEIPDAVKELEASFKK